LDNGEVSHQYLSKIRELILDSSPTAKGVSDERPLLFTLRSGNLAIQASRARLFGTAAKPRPLSTPPLSIKQIEAIDALHAIGQAVALRFEFRSGDIFFFNNMRMMHARDGFIDGNEAENTTKRYLLRLILKDERNSSEWEIPSEMETTWNDLYDHGDEDEVISIHEELFSYKAGH
jgi:hypothetical protein